MKRRLSQLGSSLNIQISATSRLIEFIIENQQKIQDEEMTLEDLSLAAKLIIDESPSDPALQELLTNFGWTSYERFIDTVDIKGLLLALKRLDKKKKKSISGMPMLQNTSLPFVPELLVSHLTSLYQAKKEGDDIVIKPYSETFQGVLLLVDISGFTKLSSAYCTRGIEGIDDLQRIVNNYLGELVAMIYAYGGDVIKFAGDAILCVFKPNAMSAANAESNIDPGRPQEPGTHTDLLVSCIENEDTTENTTTQSGSATDIMGISMMQQCCLDATRCALMLKDLSADGLSVHIGISFGDICFAVIGGIKDMWECLISGACLQDISQCLDDAKSRQIVISPDMYTLLTSQNKYKIPAVQLESGNWRVELTYDDELFMGAFSGLSPDLADNKLDVEDAKLIPYVKKFVSLAVQNELSGNNLQQIGELREVTTVFMKWDSYDLEQHKDLLTLQPFFQEAQKVLFEYGGILRQFLIDDKGCVLIALWGVPSATYIDNSMRALNACIKLQSIFSAKEMTTSFGITTGKLSAL